MLILGIDTSTDILGLALIENNKLLGEYNLSLERQHSEKLLPLVQEIFKEVDRVPSNLDAVAVATGPGSFTGLRIGITAAKMLGRIFSIPVKGISTLEVMAQGTAGSHILSLLDAKNRRVYYSFYKRLKNNIFLQELKKPAGVKISSLPEILAEYKNKNIKIVGEKADEVRKVLEKNNYKAVVSDLENNHPRAAVLASLGKKYINSAENDDIYQLKPAYLKKPQAEINWQQKYGNN